MSLPLLFTNLKSTRWGTLAWGVSVLLMGLFVVNLYASVGGIGALLDIIESYPEPLRIAIYGSATMPEMGGDGSFPLNLWVSSEFLGWAPALLAVYAIFTVGTSLAREVERGTMDLLLSQPVTRLQVVASKFATFALALAAIMAAGFLGLVLGDATIEANLNPWALFLGLFQAYLLVMAIGGYCLFFSCLFLEPRRALMASGILTAALYILNFIAPSLGSVDWLQKLSLFHYYRAPEILNNVQMDGVGVGVYLAVIIIGLATSLLVFQRRDVSA